MTAKMKVLGFDPSQSSWGVCKASVDIETMTFEVDELVLIETKSEAKQLSIRKDSDNLRRAKELREEVERICDGYHYVFSEIPFMNSGGYAASNFNAGLVTGILASVPIPIIQVFPQDVKMLFCGSRHADKAEMVDEAVKRFPQANWLRRKLKNKETLTKKNEHLADAVAVINAGLQSAQFKELVAMYKTFRRGND